jgi:hypothetical protein
LGKKENIFKKIYAIFRELWSKDPPLRPFRHIRNEGAGAAKAKNQQPADMF